MLRSAVGKTRVLRSRLVMNYTTSQKLTISTLAVKLSVSAIYYPLVTATFKIFLNKSKHRCTISFISLIEYTFH